MNELLPYATMVKNLFKHTDNPAADLMHAAIGIAGEVGELLEACTPGNLQEELGDLEFYVEAAFQELAKLRSPAPRPGPRAICFHSLDTQLVIFSARLLDVAKKAWVYGAALDVDAAYTALNCIDDALDAHAKMLGMDRDYLRRGNQWKLAKRFPEGVYSGLAAQQRADKTQ